MTKKEFVSIRETMGLSRSELASKLFPEKTARTSYQAVYAMETGINKVSLNVESTMHALLAAFRMTPKAPIDFTRDTKDDVLTALAYSKIENYRLRADMIATKLANKDFSGLESW